MNLRKCCIITSDEYKQLRHTFNEKVIASDYNDIKHLNGCVSDKVVRKWYVSHDKKIPNLVDKTKSIEEQSRQAHSLRNENRTQARNLMMNQDERKWLDESHPNLSFDEQIAKKMSDKGLTRDEAISDILATAPKSNKKVNDKLNV